MSTYFGYFCRDCTESSAHWLFHGDTVLGELLAAWPTLQPAVQFPEHESLGLWVLGYKGYDDGPLDFLRRHDGHAVFVEDEYSRIWQKSEEGSYSVIAPGSLASQELDRLHVS